MTNLEEVDHKLAIQKKELSAQMSLKKSKRNPDKVADIRKRIETLSRWRRDFLGLPAKDYTKKPKYVPPKVLGHDGVPMTEKEFDEHFRKNIVEPMGEALEIEIKTEQEVDERFHELRYANVNIKGPDAVIEYFKKKLKNFDPANPNEVKIGDKVMYSGTKQRFWGIIMDLKQFTGIKLQRGRCTWTEEAIYKSEEFPLKWLSKYKEEPKTDGREGKTE